MRISRDFRGPIHPCGLTGDLTGFPRADKPRALLSCGFSRDRSCGRLILPFTAMATISGGLTLGSPNALSPGAGFIPAHHDEANRGHRSFVCRQAITGPALFRKSSRLSDAQRV